MPGPNFIDIEIHLAWDGNYHFHKYAWFAVKYQNVCLPYKFTPLSTLSLGQIRPRAKIPNSVHLTNEFMRRQLNADQFLCFVKCVSKFQ